MKKSILIIAAVIVVVAAAAAAVVLSGDDGNGGGNGGSDDSDPVTATVWLDDGTEQTRYEGTGSTIRGILESALSGHDLAIRSNGNVASVDGVENTSTTFWTVFRWSSYYNDATGGAWKEYPVQNGSVSDGMVLALRYAQRTVDEDGTTAYAKPDIQVKEKVYFFLRVEIPLDDITGSTDNEKAAYWFDRIQNAGYSEDDLRAGLWTAGYGSTANEALADAVLRAFFPDSEVEVNSGELDGKSAIVYTVDGEDGFFSYGTSNDMYGWFTSFLGWGDTKVSSSGSEYGTWSFWNQYTYSPEARSLDDGDYWEFNQFSFGMYDITSYRYFGLVLRTSTAEGVPGDLPTPSDIPESLLEMRA